MDILVHQLAKVLPLGKKRGKMLFDLNSPKRYQVFIHCQDYLDTHPLHANFYIPKEKL